MATSAEKDFYLDEFHDKTLVFSIGHRSLAGVTARRRLRAVVADLVRHESRVLVVVGDAPLGSSTEVRLRRFLGLPPGRVERPSRALGRRGDTVVWDPEDVEESLAGIWQVLRVRSLGVVFHEGPAGHPACRIAERLRVHKLVLVDAAGGLVERGSRRTISFLDEHALDVLLAAGEAEFQGLSRRRALLGDIDRVLTSGVGSVNLCRLSGLARELFSYEGTGTLFTRGAYWRVDRLGIDDFHEVERLVERGQKEGLLKPRSPREIGELLLNGYGAWIAGDQLAGIGALRTEPYIDESAGEIIGLYTITRFKGEGIGYRLVRRLVEEARRLELSYVFAVTTAERAAQFFRREGFRQVSAKSVPAIKWEGYDDGRRSRAMVFRRELD